MPKAAVLGLIVVVALIVAFIGYTVLVKPQKAKLKTVNAEIATTQATLDQYRADAAARSATAVPKIRVADVYRLARAMPSTQDMPDLLIELNDVARAAGIKLASISPSVPTPGNGFQITSISLQFSGDYYAVTDLLYRLRTLVAVRHGQLEATGRLFSIKNVTLSPVGQELTTTVTLEAYPYGLGAAAAPVAPVAPVPASTETTTTTASAEGAP
jgi:Tfp pilus assembly protein PilO